MFKCLTDHGCPDLTTTIDPFAISPHMIAAGGYGDIWKGKLYNKTDVAIKVWRFGLATEDDNKSLKVGSSYYRRLVLSRLQY